jgi:hypothetical protein
MKKQLHFQPTAAINPMGIVLYLLLMALTTIGLGYIYSLLTIFFPFIYVNVFITIGYGLSIGYLSLLFFRISSVRDSQSKFALTLFAGLSAWIFAWVTFIVYVLELNYPTFSTYLGHIPQILHPGFFFPTIAEFNQVGLWEIAGIELKGILLAVIWLIELAIIIGFPLLILKRSKPMPYSENFRKWYPCYTLQEKFNAIHNPDRVIQELADDPVKVLQETVGGGAIFHAKAHVFYLPEEGAQYLTLENFKVQRGQETSWKSQIAINALRISTQDATRLKAQYGAKRNRWKII